MKLPKKFEEYLKEEIAKKIFPDKSRANFLINESESSLQGLKERVEKIGLKLLFWMSWDILETVSLIMEKS